MYNLNYEVTVDINSKRESEKLAKELASVRQKKISRIKTRIASGKYKISACELAKALFLAR